MAPAPCSASGMDFRWEGKLVHVKERGWTTTVNPFLRGKHQSINGNTVSYLKCFLWDLPPLCTDILRITTQHTYVWSGTTFKPRQDIALSTAWHAIGSWWDSNANHRGTGSLEAPGQKGACLSADSIQRNKSRTLKDRSTLGSHESTQRFTASFDQYPSHWHITQL